MGTMRKFEIMAKSLEDQLKPFLIDIICQGLGGLNQIWSTLIWNESTASSFLWKQRQNHFSKAVCLLRLLPASAETGEDVCNSRDNPDDTHTPLAQFYFVCF